MSPHVVAAPVVPKLRRALFTALLSVAALAIFHVAGARSAGPVPAVRLVDSVAAVGLYTDGARTLLLDASGRAALCGVPIGSWRVDDAGVVALTPPASFVVGLDAHDARANGFRRASPALPSPSRGDR